MPFDETEFEDEPGSPSAQTSLDALKRKALDRLEEVLARFKTPRPHEQGGGSAANTRRNLDAKNVTAVVLMEDVDSVAIVCAKNEGVDHVDVRFLQWLGETLEKVSRQGAMEDDDVDGAFNIILCHSEHRLAFYSQIISIELKQVPREPAEDHRNYYQEKFRPSDPRHWEGLVIKPYLDQKQDYGASEIDSDCLSDIEGQTLVASVLGEIETLVPNMRKRIMDLDRASTPMYPTLKNRTRSQTSEGENVSHHVDCDCRVYDMVCPPGLYFFGSTFNILEELGLCAM